MISVFSVYAENASQTKNILGMSELPALGATIGKLTFAGGVALDAVGVSAYYLDRDSKIGVKPYKAGSNLGIAMWSISSGVFTAVPGALYFGVDLMWTGGFGGFLNERAALERANQKILGRTWRLSPRGGGN